MGRGGPHALRSPVMLSSVVRSPLSGPARQSASNPRFPTSGLAGPETSPTRQSSLAWKEGLALLFIFLFVEQDEEREFS